jgi:hypothetical protein
MKLNLPVWLKRSDSRPKTKWSIWMALLIGVGVGLAVSIFTLTRSINKDSDVVHAYDFTDSASIYSLKYPRDWTLQLEQLQCANDCPEMPNWDQVSRGVLLVPPGEHVSSGAVTVQGYTLNQAEADKTDNLTSDCVATDDYHQVQVIKVNGYDVCYDYLDWWRDDLSEGIKAHTYTYRKGDYFVKLSFTERYFNAWGNNQDDNSQYLPAFRAIVRTVDFLR